MILPGADEREAALLRRAPARAAPRRRPDDRALTASAGVATAPDRRPHRRRAVPGRRRPPARGQGRRQGPPRRSAASRRLTSPSPSAAQPQPNPSPTSRRPSPARRSKALDPGNRIKANSLGGTEIVEAKLGKVPAPAPPTTPRAPVMRRPPRPTNAGDAAKSAASPRMCSSRAAAPTRPSARRHPQNTAEAKLFLSGTRGRSRCRAPSFTKVRFKNDTVSCRMSMITFITPDPPHAVVDISGPFAANGRERLHAQRAPLDDQRGPRQRGRRRWTSPPRSPTARASSTSKA